MTFMIHYNFKTTTFLGLFFLICFLLQPNETISTMQPLAEDKIKEINVKGD